MIKQKKRKPRGEEKMDQNLHIRGTKSQVDFLEMLSYEHGKTKTELIWKALEFYHNCYKPPFN